MGITILSGSTHNRADMSSSGIIQEQSLDTAWGMMRDEAPLAALLNAMPSGRFAPVANTTKPFWALGDYPSEDDALDPSAGFTFDDSEGAPTAVAAWTNGTVSRIKFVSSRFFAGDIVHISHATLDYYVTVKLGAADTAPQYVVAQIISTNVPDAGGDVEFAAGTRVEILASAVDYDGYARDFLNVRADLLYNHMQRIRETVGAGQVERSNQYLTDRSLENLVKLGFGSFAKKLEKSLFLNHSTYLAGTGATDTGIMGGIPYFLNPHGASSGIASTSSKGINKVFSASSVSYNDLIAWMEELTVKGSKDKLVFLSPYMMRLVIEALQGIVSIQRENFGSVNPGFENVFNPQSAEFAFGKLRFIVHRGLTGVKQVVKDKDNSSLVASPLKYMVAIDPNDIGLQHLNVVGEGVATPKIRDVFKERNNSIEEIEFDTIATLAIGDPEAHGYFGITS